MTALEIVGLLNALTQLAPSVIKLAQQASAAMSADDQAAVNAAIANLKASASVDLDTALTDLDAAATT